MRPGSDSLPATWSFTSIASLCEVGAGDGAPQGAEHFSTGTHLFVRMQDVGRSTSPYITTTTDRLNELALRKHRLRQWPSGALLIPKSGASVALNNRALLASPAFVVSHLAVVVPGPWVNSEYLYFLSCTLDMMRLAQDPGYPSLRISDLSKLRIPIPPLSEQGRIVEILHESEQIRQLREKAEWQSAQIISAAFRNMFGDPVLNPKDWPISNLRQLLQGTPKNGLYKPSEAYGNGTPIIRIGNFYDGRLNHPSEFQQLRISDAEIAQFTVSEGDVLVNRVNSMEYLGKSALVKGLREPTVYESNMMRLRPDQQQILPEFLVELFQQPSFLAKLRGKAKKAVNQASINQSDILSLRCPVPPLGIQRRFIEVVQEVESIRVLDKRSGETTGLLLESLLARAFTGELTAEWRERNADKLEQEARERDAALAASGVKLSRAPKAPDIEAIFTRRTDGAYAELTREQHTVLEVAQKAVGGVKTPRWFTAEHIARQLGGTWRKHIHAIESALGVLAARGLVIPVSREDAQPITGEIYYGTAYRLPLKTYEVTLGDEAGNKIVDNEGTGILLGETDGDKARQRELKRFAEQLRKGRPE